MEITTQKYKCWLSCATYLAADIDAYDAEEAAVNYAKWYRGQMVEDRPNIVCVQRLPGPVAKYDVRIHTETTYKAELRNIG